MKKTFTIIICLFTAVLLEAQITSSEIISKKTYENKTQTTYLKLSGHISSNLIEGLTEHMESRPYIQKFSFYDQSNHNNCMFTADISITLPTIICLINEFLFQFDISTDSIDFQNTVYFENYKVVKFYVNNIESDKQKTETLSSLLKHEGIISVEINPDNICKLTISKDITKKYIQKTFETHKLKIRVIQKH